MVRIPLILLVFTFSCFAQQSLDPLPSCKERGQRIVGNLRNDNMLRRYIETGSVGDCVRKSWMDKMNQLKIKQATFLIEYSWKKDELMFKIKSISYWTDYFDGRVIKGRNISKSGLETDLRDFILDRVKFEWKVKRGKNSVSPDTFNVYVFDDEALPVSYSIY